jgi:hypothetical protein
MGRNSLLGQSRAVHFDSTIRNRSGRDSRAPQGKIRQTRHCIPGHDELRTEQVLQRKLLNFSLELLRTLFSLPLQLFYGTPTPTCSMLWEHHSERCKLCWGTPQRRSRAMCTSRGSGGRKKRGPEGGRLDWTQTDPSSGMAGTVDSCNSMILWD